MGASATLGRGVGQIAADDSQGGGGAAESEFGLFGSDEVSVHQVVHVDAHAAVDVHGGVRFGRVLALGCAVLYEQVSLGGVQLRAALLSLV